MAPDLDISDPALPGLAELAVVAGSGGCGGIYEGPGAVLRRARGPPLKLGVSSADEPGDNERTSSVA